MFDDVTNRPSRWRNLWPDVDDVESARSASRQGMWAALVVAVVTGIVAAFQGLGLNWYAFVDVGMFLLIAWGIRRVSRMAAVAGLVLFVIERIAIFGQTKQTGGIVAIALLLAFGNGARGAFAYRRLKKASGQTPVAP